MRFYIILFFCLAAFFISCNTKDEIPADILNLHDMAGVLTDIHIVDGSLYSVPQQPDSMAKHGLGLYIAVFKVHHTDTAQFKKSMRYYSLHPDKLNTIYDDVIKGLTKKVDSLQKSKPKAPPIDIKAKHKLDSITQAKIQPRLDSVRKAQAKLLEKAKAVKKHKSKKKKKKKHALPTE